MPRKVFITGITGFTGSHMAKLLISKNIVVAGIAKSSRRLKNIELIRNKVKFWSYDIYKSKDLKRILINFAPDYIFHFASPIIRKNLSNRSALKKNLRVDLFATLEFLKIANRLVKKPKILITGTAAEYHILNNKPVKENHPLFPQNGYGLSKLAQESAAFLFAKENGLPLIYTRNFHLIGPGQEPTFVVSDLAKQIAQAEVGLTKPLLNIGNPLMKRDFLDVRDAVRAYWLIINKSKIYEVYNVCSQKSHSIQQIINFFVSESKVKIKVKKEKRKFRKGEAAGIIGNNQKLKHLGWQPKFNFQASLLDTLNYWRNFLNISK